MIIFLLYLIPFILIEREFQLKCDRVIRFANEQQLLKYEYGYHLELKVRRFWLTKSYAKLKLSNNDYKTWREFRKFVYYAKIVCN